MLAEIDERLEELRVLGLHGCGGDDELGGDVVRERPGRRLELGRGRHGRRIVVQLDAPGRRWARDHG